MIPFRFIPYPELLSWQDWADTVVGYNPLVSNLVDPNSDWRDFGEGLTQFDSRIPQPRGFSSWQAWAREVKLVLGV